MKFRVLFFSISMICFSLNLSAFEYDGLYKGTKLLSPEQNVNFCTVFANGTSMMSVLNASKANAAILTDINDIKSITIDDFNKLILQYDIDGTLKFSLGSTISGWKQVGLVPFEHPCIDSDDTINFIEHVTLGFNKMTKGNQNKLTFSTSAYNSIRNFINKYPNIPVYALIWESVDGRHTDKGWVVRIKRK